MPETAPTFHERHEGIESGLTELEIGLNELERQLGEITYIATQTLSRLAILHAAQPELPDITQN